MNKKYPTRIYDKIPKTEGEILLHKLFDMKCINRNKRRSPFDKGGATIGVSRKVFSKSRKIVK